MVCPFRKGSTFNVQVIGGKPVLCSAEEMFPKCYEEECPYYDYYGKCRAVEKELEED